MFDIYNVSVTSKLSAEINMPKIFLDTSTFVKILLFLLFISYDFLKIRFNIYFALCKR